MDFNKNDKRKSIRVPFPCRVIIKTVDQELVSHVDNISKGGIKVVLAKKLEHLSCVSLKLFLKKDQPIDCEGKVVWIMDKINTVDSESTMFHIGIAFVGMQDEDREKIKKIVDALA